MTPPSIARGGGEDQPRPSLEEWQARRVAWKVPSTVKSNAIVYARAGQAWAWARPDGRVDSVKIGAMKACCRCRHGGGVDAFFPFPDGVEEAVAHGATAFTSRRLGARCGSDRGRRPVGRGHGLQRVRHFRH